MKQIVLAEKPSVAKSIKAVIAPHAVSKEGYMEDQNYIITYAFGHLLELAEPDQYDQKYEKWTIEDLPILPDNFRLVVNKNAAAQFKIIKTLLTSNKVNGLILATDAGREGQLIGEYIYMATGCKLPVKRLWITSYTDEAIKRGFENLKPGSNYKNLADAARCRSEMDWAVGINCTRAMSIKTNCVLNVGRVITPTLAFIVNRELEIINFQPKPFYELIVNFGNKYAGKWFKDKEDRFLKKEDALEMLNLIRGKMGEIVEFKEEIKTQNPPLLHDINDLQKEANILYGYGAAKTLDIAQALYQNHKILSYPRTDCRYLDSTQKTELPKILSAIKDIPEVKDFIPKQFIINNRLINDKKMAGSDHHAIIPTEKKPQLEALSKEEKNIYLLVVRRLIAAFLPSCKGKKTTIITEVEGEQFYSGYTQLIEKGWKQIYEVAQLATEEEDEFAIGPCCPEVKKSEQYKAETANLNEGVTTAPKRYTEATLLTAMETCGKTVEDEEQREILKQTKGIGTPATRAEVIERLFKNKFIVLKGKNLVPTEFGIRSIQVIPISNLKSAELTAVWEQKLKEVEKGNLNRTQLINEIKIYTTKVIEIIKNMTAAPLEKNPPVGKCPDCGSDILENKAGYYCKNSRDKTCSFPTIWKIVSGKKLSKIHVMQLLTKGETGLIKGFKYEDRKYDARLRLNRSTGKVERIKESREQLPS